MHLLLKKNYNKKYNERINEILKQIEKYNNRELSNFEFVQKVSNHYSKYQK